MTEATNHVENRVSALEVWKGEASHEISTHKDRLDSHDKQFDKTDKSMQRLWERFDEQRDMQVRTQTLVEVGNRDTAELKASFQAWKEAQDKSRTQDARDARERRPKWVQATIAGGALIVALISLVALLMRG